MSRMAILACFGAAFIPSVALAQATAPGAKGAAAAAAAQDGSAEMTTATFGDWQLRCRNPAAATGGQPAAQRSCEVVQSVVIQGQSAPFAQLAFGKAPPADALFFTAVLPTNIALPSAVRFLIDDADKQPVELAWTRCLPGGCFASIATKDDFLKRWRAQNEGGRFIFKSAAGQDVTVPFSFRGLSRALDALAKQG